jgi:2-polyprenyl-6-methoxyphenol hydroxylase-like FAD-dependent oxidoreductase
LFVATAICIQRDRLTAVLLESARKYSNEITIEHNVAVSSVKWDSEGPEVVLERHGDGNGAQQAVKEKLRPSLLIGADGFRSVVAKALEEEKVSPLKVVSYPDTNTRVYKTIPLEYDLCEDPSSWRRDLNFSASSQGKADITLEVLPTKEGKGVGVALFKPGNVAIDECDTADKVKKMVESNFPQFKDVIPERAFAEFAKQRVQRLPIFQYAANSLVGPKTALVGDSIHTVKPYFGLGVNSAFEDIGVLRDSLQTLQTALGGSLDASLERYSESHKHNARAMVQMSRTFDQGFFKFVLPIILDTFFHKLLPQVFSTNCIRILQQHDMPFAQAGAIKRRDRALQIAIISIVLLPAAAVLLRFLKWFVKWVMTA